MGQAGGPLIRSAGILVPLLLLLASGLSILSEPPLLTGIRDSVFDFYQRLSPRPSAPSPVVVVDIDDASLSRIGQWPWPRRRLAELIDYLAASGARVIALDLLLAEPDRVSSDSDADLTLALAGGRVVTGFALTDEGADAKPALKAGFAIEGGGGAPLSVPDYRGAITTLPGIEAAAAGNGALNVPLTTSGVVRRAPMLLRIGNQPYPGLTAEALRVAQGAEGFTLATTAQAQARPEASLVRGLKIGAMFVPTDETGQIWIYYAPLASTAKLPAWQAIEGSADMAEIRDRIVLVGSSATGLQDLHPTPLSPVTPGVLIHAQVIEQLLVGAVLQRPDWAKGAEVLLLATLSALVLLLGARGRPLAAAVAGAAATTAAIAVSWLAFRHGRLLLDPVLPAAAVLAIFGVSSVMRHLQTDRQQRWLRKAFASYVAPSVVDELVRDPQRLALGGARREITSLFTDLEGFTPLVEKNPPERIVPVLNAYLDGLIRIVLGHQGTVDKIIGDAIHAIFGAPLPSPDHAARAVACALEIAAFGRRFAGEQRAAGLAFGMTRIGVNSGAAIIGNFGGALRFDYTAHGDAVNTAARLEGANKHLGTQILVSAATAVRCPDFRGRPAGTLLLKGKTDPVAVFEPLDDADPGWLKAYEAAYQAMAEEQPAAKALFAALVARYPDDRLAALHCRRLQAGERGATVVLTGK